GLKYDLNTLIPIDSGIDVRPYKHCTGIIQLPHVWEDDVHCMCGWSYKNILNDFHSYKGLLILDFHPIHIFLNSKSLDNYKESKKIQNDFEKLFSYRNNDYGTEKFLFDLIFLKNN